ncbi:hypothetical protein H2Y57_12670 [Pectobacterium aroidearum]|uniref:Uncharacterized protein n=1 Tax=Pectobacterium aroidearum TaxID=1201031 RepID=A0AAW3SS30_9GAMM|nr:hypothetical protein [Pectobacterium aroidearum]MBA5204529.1 hypothetical protein [Pectobacterium aroidearum]
MNTNALTGRREKSEHIAIIEVKECDIREGRFIYKDMIDYRKAIGNDGISVYIISSKPNYISNFLVHSFDDKGNIHTIHPNLFPSLETLSAKETTDRKAELMAQQKNTSNIFKKVC